MPDDLAHCLFASLVPTTSLVASGLIRRPPSPTAVSSPTVAPSPTADPYADLTIAALAGRAYGGGLLEITDTLETNDAFTRYESNDTPATA